jgi:CheY-like chemotaxis protein
MIDSSFNTEPAATPARTKPERKRVLIADDSAEIRESLGKLLRKAGYETAFAAHGGHVLDRVLNERFDLLLLDLKMPHMDGWDALDHLVAMKPALPILVITAHPNQREWVHSAGARAFMEKPLDLPLLLQTIEILTQAPPPEDELFGGGFARRERFRYGPSRQESAHTEVHRLGQNADD